MSTRPLKILVVHDEPSVITQFVHPLSEQIEKLTGLSVEFKFATTGQQCVRLSCDFVVDIILIGDFKHEAGNSLESLIKEIHSVDRDAKIILIQEVLPRNFQQSGVLGWCSPYSLHHNAAKICQFLRQKMPINPIIYFK